MQEGAGQPEQEREAGEHATGDQGEDAGCGVALAEIGKDVQRDDDPDEREDQEIGREVGAGQEVRQVFAWVAWVAGVTGLNLPSRISTSCESRSSGTGKTITVFRSTPISVRVCR